MRLLHILLINTGIMLTFFLLTASQTHAEQIKLTCFSETNRSTNYIIDMESLSVRQLHNDAPWVKLAYVSDDYLGWLSETPAPSHIMMTISVLDRYTLRMITAGITSFSFEPSANHAEQLAGAHSSQDQCSRGL
jgi:hypothetical protein